MKKILFVCTGNICRSPMAEGILRKKLLDFNFPAEVDSCGFESFHAGDPPDARAVKVSEMHGIDIKNHRARLFTIRDLKYFDHIYVMDSTHYQKINRLISEVNDQKKVDYLLNVLNPNSNQPVPDPWYDDLRAFEQVYEMLDKACECLVQQLVNKES